MAGGAFSKKTYADQYGAPKQAFPWIFGIIFISGVQKNRPLITGDNHFAILQSLLDSSIR
jgi:hypothetical protein